MSVDRSRSAARAADEAMARVDDALVERIQDGDLSAFDELMRRYEKLVCKIALNYVRDRETALDVTQNVFVKAYRHIDRVRAEGMWKPWLLRITYNESMSMLRRKRPEQAGDALEQLGAEAAEPPDQELGMLRREDESSVLEGLAHLNPKYKLALSLRYGEGMRVREIADVMGCSEGVVKSLLFRGVRKIRDHIRSTADA